MTTCKVVIELVVEGKLEDAIDVIETLLDEGYFQDSINGWDPDERPLLVTSALCRMGEPDEEREP